MFNCKIYHDIGENTSMTLHNQDYKCLKDISEGLGLTYQQVADLSSLSLIYSLISAISDFID